MAFVDLVGHCVAPETNGYLDVTHRRFEPVVFDLLPRGPAWDREDPVLQRLVASMATELSRVDRRGRTLLFKELDPSKTLEMLTDWEEMLGLPDCAQPETIEARRAAIVAKLLAQAGHDQSLAYWQSVLEALGFTFEWVVNGYPGMTCEDECDDILYEDEWQFVWELAVESMGADLDALLACIVGKQALIETLALVHLLWQGIEISGGDGIVRGLAATQNGYMVAVGEDGLVYTASTDLETWTLVAPPTAADFFCACHGGVDGDVLVAAGTAGVVFRSVDGGATWDAAADATAVIRDAFGLSRGHQADDVVVLVGHNGLIVRSTNVGDTWTGVTSPTAKPLHAVTRCAGAMVAVAATGRIIRSTDNGASWTLIVDDDLPDLYGVGAWGSVVVAVGAGGVIRLSDDAGASWKDITSPTAEDLRAVTRSPSGRWTACGFNGTILQSLDDGETWIVRETNNGSDLYAAAASFPFGRAIVAGDTGTAFVE